MDVDGMADDENSDFVASPMLAKEFSSVIECDALGSSCCVLFRPAVQGQRILLRSVFGRVFVGHFPDLQT
jgi:hypothetical protein